MHQVRGLTSGGEWRQHWPIVMAGMLGYSFMGLHLYGFGPLVAPLEKEFGWSRTDIMIGLTLSNGMGVLFNFFIGMLVDKFGPRRVGLTGIVIKCMAFSMLGTATGTIMNWSLLWLFLAAGVVLTQATIWTSAVVSRFDKGRGLAIAFTLAGTSLAGALLPVLVSFLVLELGWRAATLGTAVIWFVLAFPIVFFFFRGRQDVLAGAKKDDGQPPLELPGYTLKEGLRTSAFWRIAAANFAFAFYTVVMASNLIPLLGTKGATPMVAAQIAALVGVVGLIARLSAGHLLDKLPPNAVATCIFLLPVLGSALLLMDTPGYWVLALAVISFGVTIGAEYDVVLFLISRHLGLKSYGALLGALLSAGAVAGVVAPMGAGWIFDQTGSYDAVLIICMVLMGSAAVIMATLGAPKRNWGLSGH